MQTLLDADARYSYSLRLKKEKGLPWYVAVFFAHSGDSWFWIFALLMIWFFAGPDWHRRATVLGLSVFIQAVTVLAIKFSIRRKRPESDWGDIYRKTDPHSFPSGHATRSFLLATMALGLGPAWFGWLLVFWAPLVCLARVALGVHFLSDVLVGMLLGILLGLVLLQLQPYMFQFEAFLIEHVFSLIL